MSSLVCMVSSCEEDGNLAEGGYKPSLKACYLETDGTEFLKSADAQTWNTQVYAGENSWKFNGYDNWINLTPNSGIGPQSVLFSVQKILLVLIPEQVSSICSLRNLTGVILLV